MGMSTHIILFRSKNDRIYQKFLKILLSCKDAGIEPPKEVDDYFGGYGIDNDPEAPLTIKFKPKEWRNNDSEGCEIDLEELPEGVKTIRFYNSW